MGQGFFDLGVPEPTTSSKSFQKKIGCDACGRNKTTDNPDIPLWGNGGKSILIIREWPIGAEENQEPLKDRYGRILKLFLKQQNLDVEKDVWVTYGVTCAGKIPDGVEITECRIKLLTKIKKINPKIIIPFGTISISALIGHRISGRLNKAPLSAFIGGQIPDNELNAWVCPNYSTKYMETYSDNDNVLENIWKDNIKKALELINKPIKIYKTEPNIIYNVEKATEFLKELRKITKTIAFDYETTGIKPHRKEQEIVAASVSWKNECASFPWFKDEEFQTAWKKLMLDWNIGKVAHNNSFELIWTKEKLGYWPNNMVWDTCIGAHCENNRKPTNLKFQTYIKLGILGYDTEVDTYITATPPGEDPKSTNSLNQIKDAPLPELLKYNALDSFYTNKLYIKQIRALTEFQKEGMFLFLSGVFNLACCSQQGLKMNSKMIYDESERLVLKINRYKKIIADSKEAQQYKKELNPTSDKQMRELLYGILKYKEPKENKTDEKALEKIGTKFTRNILQYRRLLKMKDTYLGQFKREMIDGIIHPGFNLQIAKTFRSSSSNPNFQNIPKRNPIARKIIRSTIIPSPGNKLIEYDYKGVEVAVSCCYHKDKNMINYIKDPSNNMHTDTATDLFLLNKKEVNNKTHRHWAKNGFVFPAFYGSAPNSITPGIWEELDEKTLNHLFSKGIKKEAHFFQHVDKTYKIFWDDRFPEYKKWKYKIHKEYLNKGYLESFTGFKLYGPMKFTEATNCQIQGSAFHCLLWTLNKIWKKVQDISGRSYIIGQIHDALVGDIHPDDEKEVDKLIYEWGTQKIREFWDWIIVPLSIEKEASEIDGDWSEMKDCGHLKKIN